MAKATQWAEDGAWKEIQRLKRHGWSDMASRPDAYPSLVECLGLRNRDFQSMDLSSRRDLIRPFIIWLTEQIDLGEASEAWRILLDLPHVRKPAPYENRVRAADRTFVPQARDNLSPREGIHWSTIYKRTLIPLDKEMRSVLPRRSSYDPDVVAPSRSNANVPALREWEADLDEAFAAVSQQRWHAAAALIGRHSARRLLEYQSEAELILAAKTAMILGDMHRDRGQLRAAKTSYAEAASHYAALHMTAHRASAELMLAVVAEMSGTLNAAAKSYESLVDSDFLSPFERAKARLWFGSTLTKLGSGDTATQQIALAMQSFESMGRQVPGAQLKLALARLHTIGPDAALRGLHAATLLGDVPPLQVVRRDVTEARLLLHIGEIDEGVRILRHATSLALTADLGHQLSKIVDMQKRYDVE